MDDLPIILVSAANDTAAKEIISEIIDNDVSIEYTRGEECEERVWRLVNKYYRADVRLRPLGDQRAPGPAPAPALDGALVEAHVIYITQHELQQGAACCERRARAAGPSWARHDVERAVLVQGKDTSVLEPWAAGARALLVARGEEPAPTAREPFAEARGVQRLRDQLHAHAWRNHARIDAPSRDVCSLLDQWCEEAEEEEEGGVSVGALLQLVGAARDARGSSQRVERAERVLRALCAPPRRY